MFFSPLLLYTFALSRDQPQSKFAFLKCAGFSTAHAQTTPPSAPLQVQTPYKSYQENPFVLYTYTTHVTHVQPAKPSLLQSHSPGCFSLPKARRGGTQLRGDDFQRWSGFGPEETGLCGAAEGTPARCTHPAERGEPRLKDVAISSFLIAGKCSSDKCFLVNMP